MLELIQLDAAMILPTDIARAVAKIQAQTVANPYLALNHAFALDKQLADLGWDTPITYSAQGIAGLGWVLGETSPNAALKGALIDGHTQTQLGATQTGLLTAFHSAHGVEIPALNLLYANQSVVIETLWLHFLNKYLAYFAPGANPHTYSLALTAPGQERFHRLRQKHTPAVEPAGPMISVLMPMYNAAATLNTAVASIRGQSWQNFELLLIDDCSQDNSLAIAQRLAEQDPRIKVIPLRTNGGPYIAKNIGLGFAKGDFITVHDADDWAFPTRLADQIRPLLNDATGTLKVSMGKTLRITASGQFTRFQPPNWVTNDGAMRWCFPSPLFERRYFVEHLGAWDSVTVGADTEIIQRIRRFEPQALEILDIPVMLQLDAEGSLTRNANTHNDERGEAPVRTEYRKNWTRWHAIQTHLPKLAFPLTQRPFAVPDGMQKLALSNHVHFPSQDD